MLLRQASVGGLLGSPSLTRSQSCCRDAAGISHHDPDPRCIDAKAGSKGNTRPACTRPKRPQPCFSSHGVPCGARARPICLHRGIIGPPGCSARNSARYRGRSTRHILHTAGFRAAGAGG